MSARWTAKEHSTLIEMLVDGVSIQSIVDAIPSKSEGAIVTRARNKRLGLNYRTSRKDGKLYKGVKRRTHYSKEKQSDGTVNIVGTSRVAVTTPEVKIERSSQNISESIITNKSTDTVKSDIVAIYDAIVKLLNDTQYSTIQSISVELNNSRIKLSKDSA